SDPSTVLGNAANTRDAVARLERELASEARRGWLWRLGIPVLGVSGWRGYRAWAQAHEPPAQTRGTEASVEGSSAVLLVHSTGRLNPLNEVQVGAQVSVRVVRVLADFNSRVKQGQLLAEIDPQLFGAQVGQVKSQLDAASANVEQARARVQVTELDLQRIRNLSHEGIVSQGDLDQAKS